MRLALKLQFRSVEQLQDQLSPAEIHEWLAFELLEHETSGEHGTTAGA